MSKWKQCWKEENDRKIRLDFMIEKLPLLHNDYFKKKDVIQIIQELKKEWEVK